MLQSSIFGLGVIAQRLPKGQFVQLAQIVPILEKSIAHQPSEGMAEDERDSLLALRDNTISALTKMILFHYDGGAVLRDDLVNQVLTQMHPITHDFDEAQDINGIILNLILKNENEAIAKFKDSVKVLVTKVKDYAVAHQNEEESQILNDNGKQLLEQVISQL
mmetsp:Transcript_15259/g.25808  ORF Transcript_15259/g.25808 Transcript_15259/m.25808 type:complete len:163 (-) Transcript_15259:146-634(-)